MEEPLPFERLQQLQQSKYFNARHPDRPRYKDSEYRLSPEAKDLNLAPAIRDTASRYFAANDITWHIHANHALSSQICCLNFLMPLAEQPERLAQMVRRATRATDVEMLPIEDGPDGRPWYVGFEWNGGGRDFLNEARSGGNLKRGSNSTSADAIVKYKHKSKTEILLVEWKYTEQYSAPISARGNPTRMQRYRDLAFAPKGPIRADLGLTLANFFWEPFYQLLRQQMLALQMQRASFDGVQRVRVLHISPAGNRALHRVTSPALRRFGDDAFDVFRALLTVPADFISTSAEALFRPLLDSVLSDDPWAGYLLPRYQFLSHTRPGGTL
jgi:hypothetical protein